MFPWHRMPAGRSPRRPATCGRASSGRPHLVGVSTAKDLELLGVLPGLAVPDHGDYAASLSAAAGSASMMSMLRWESCYALCCTLSVCIHSNPYPKAQQSRKKHGCL